MAWINKQTYWYWVEDRKKTSDGKFIGHIPDQPTVKRFDRVTINKGVTGHEFALVIGVWDDDTYTPLHRDELEFFTKQYTFDPTMKGAVLVNRPTGEARYLPESQTWEWVQHEVSNS